MIYLNYDSVIQMTISDPDKNNDVRGDIIYRELTETEGMRIDMLCTSHKERRLYNKE
jgi:hypothetical protein